MHFFIFVFLGANLPRDEYEVRQNHLIEYFHNIFNSLSAESEAEPVAEANTDCIRNIKKFFEVLESHRYGVYNPGIVRLLQIVKQYLEKPFIEYFEYPLVNFVRLIEGPVWEECAEKLRNSFCTDIYIDVNSEVMDNGNIGVYMKGASLCELKSVKSNLDTYMDKTINPPTAEVTNKNDSETTETCKSTTTSDKTNAHANANKEEETSTDNEKRQDLTMEDVETTPVSFELMPEDSVKQSIENVITDKKRDSQSADRSLRATDGVNAESKQTFIRSKSVPANSSMDTQEPTDQRPKRAKYDSECSNEDILQSNTNKELTLFKENITLVLINSPEDNNNSLINV